MSWHLKAELIESCSCDMLCPCWFGTKELMIMDQGWCASPLFFRIQEGASDGVTLDGCVLVVAADYPGPTLLDGKGTGRIYIDEKSTPDQRRALERIFRGERGGPMAIIAGLIDNWLPNQYPAIEVQEDDDTVTATVGHFGHIRSDLLRSEAGDLMTMQHAGFFGALQFKDETGQMAPSKSHWFDPEMPRSYETRSGVRGSFHWQEE
jgi:hypothetical protein